MINNMIKMVFINCFGFGYKRIKLFSVLIFIFIFNYCKCISCVIYNISYYISYFYSYGLGFSVLGIVFIFKMVLIM